MARDRVWLGVEVRFLGTRSRGSYQAIVKFTPGAREAAGSPKSSSSRRLSSSPPASFARRRYFLPGIFFFFFFFLSRCLDSWTFLSTKTPAVKVYGLFPGKHCKGIGLRWPHRTEGKNGREGRKKEAKGRKQGGRVASSWTLHCIAATAIFGTSLRIFHFISPYLAEK